MKRSEKLNKRDIIVFNYFGAVAKGVFAVPRGVLRAALIKLVIIGKQYSCYLYHLSVPPSSPQTSTKHLLTTASVPQPLPIGYLAPFPSSRFSCPCWSACLWIQSSKILACLGLLLGRKLFPLVL